jgi:hypothetical protein
VGRVVPDSCPSGPNETVHLGKEGTLYGTTIGSGMNAGAVFKIRP